MKPHSRSWPAAIVARPLPAFDGDGDDDKDKDKGIDLSDPKVQSAIKAAVEEQTAGLKANRDEVLAEKRELKKQMDELKAQWGDLDPKAVTELMKRFENDEEAKLIAEGKFDEVVQRRVDRMQKDAQAQVEAAQKRAEEMEQRLRASEERAKNLAIDSRLDRAARELELVPSAVDDARERARRTFTIDDDGNVIARDKDGTTIFGKDGKTPMQPEEWLEGMRKTAPHWWAPSSGGGANGSGDGRRDGAEGADLDKMSPRDKLRAGLRKQAEQ